MICPICRHEDFETYSRRENARCAHCGSLERGRLAWLVMDRLELISPEKTILNCAPEPFMLFFGSKIFGENYYSYDFNPELFSKYKKNVKKLDLCGSLAELEGRRFDVILHNHVLEHIPCSVPAALGRLNDVLTPGGYHIFSVPMVEGRTTTEDLSPDLSSTERRRRFGQEDHLRMFGSLDFKDLLKEAKMLYGMIAIDSLLSESDLVTHGIPASALTQLNGHHVFVYRNANFVL